MKTHTSSKPERKWLELATLIIASITCVATLWTLWVFARQLHVMRDEERAEIEESAARLKAIGGLLPGVNPRTLLVGVGVVHEGAIRATKIQATAEVILTEWPSGHEIRVLTTVQEAWDSMDSDPKAPDDERKLIDEQVDDAPLNFQELERTKKTVLVRIHLNYFNGFRPVNDVQCLKWLPKFAYKGSDAGAGGLEDYGNGAAGLVPCETFKDYVHDAEIHKADQ